MPRKPGLLPPQIFREEVLEAQFTELLGRLKFDDEVLEWVRDALHASHADERREHEEAIKRHQAEYKRLQDRINAMYVDKRDGIIDTAFFEKMSNQWRAEQNRCLREIEQHQNADKSFMDEGVKLLDLARNAQRLFAKQEPGESAAFSISDYRAAPGRTAKWLPPSANPLTCLRKQLRPPTARKLAGRTICPKLRFGWGTWTRTKTSGVRVRCSTIKLFPKSAAGPSSCWSAFRLGVRPARAAAARLCCNFFTTARGVRTGTHNVKRAAAPPHAQARQKIPCNSGTTHP